MTRRVKLSIPAGKANASAGQAPPRNEVISPLAAGSGAPREAANGAPLRLLPTVPTDGAARPAAAGAEGAGNEFATDAQGDNALRTRPPATPPNPDRSFVGVLLLALAGGLVLNLMPCVLPILSLKVLSLAQSGESPQRARSHALWYTLGVLVAFAVIGALMVGLRAIGNAVGIGFQLQHPGVVAALAYIMFAVGLSLSGVFTLGGGMAVQRAVADRWRAVTGKSLAQAYGLTETSPAVTVNPLDVKVFTGSIGLPRRNLRARTPGHARLLEPARRNRAGDVPGRLPAHGRHWLRR
ncbi:hypothetical protein G6F59_013233 [Rhizopus arrhizus]|nr:hypothetical protein G6F59_013233 [Rhizopus arrhizus]